jgi:hypothetical protein
LKVPVVVSTIQASWDYVIDRVGFTTTMLASVTVTLKDTASNLAPFGSAAIVLECACH